MPGGRPTFFYTFAWRYLRPGLWLPYAEDGASAHPPSVAALSVASSCWDDRNQQLRVRPWPARSGLKMCDCGGFVFGRRYGGFPFSPKAYIRWLEEMRPDVAATMDLPCEVEIARDDREVVQRQIQTLRYAEYLLGHRAGWAWAPVVQGRTIAQYVDHARAYADCGMARPIMGIGSLCRRTSAREVHDIVRAVAEVLPNTVFHLFGVKLQVITGDTLLHPAVAGMDSAAWNGRFGEDIPQFNAEMAARRWTQDETAIRWALSRYQARVDAALDRQMELRAVPQVRAVRLAA